MMEAAAAYYEVTGKDRHAGQALSTKPYAVPEEPQIIGQSTTTCPKKPVGTFLLSLQQTTS